MKGAEGNETEMSIECENSFVIINICCLILLSNFLREHRQSLIEDELAEV